MPAPRRLYLHVGLQKTGTSYLQAVMLRNADALAASGLDLVPATKREAFELMLLVRERYNPDRDPASVAGALDRLTTALEHATGDRALLSQESLAAARAGQVSRLLEACGDREVHVVVTARDLARGLPSSWQQELKAGRTDGYRRYLTRLRTAQEKGRRGHPWIHLDPAAVLAAWGEQLPPERLHVVTVPPPGSPPTLLLERFCHVLGVDPAVLEPEESAANTSLGRVQAEVLRRVNAGLPDELRRRQVYGDVGKRFFAAQVLAGQDGRPIRVPGELREWCDAVTAEQVATIRRAGYDVVGDLDDLRCPETAFSDQERRPSEREVSEVAVAALARMLELRLEGLQRRRSQRPARGGVRARLRRAWRRRTSTRGAGTRGGPSTAEARHEGPDDDA